MSWRQSLKMTDSGGGEFVKSKMRKIKRSLSKERNGGLPQDESREDDLSEVISTHSATTGRENSVQTSYSLRSASGSSVYYKGEILGSSSRDTRNMEIHINDFDDNPFIAMKVVKYDDIPMLKSEDEVIIRVESTTVSKEDCEMRSGTYSWKTKEPLFPFVPGLDCVGIVISCGKLVNNITVGDRVASLVAYGANTRYIRLPYYDLVKVPEGVSSDDAVSMIRVYVGAFQALATTVSSKKRYKTKLLRGKRVLVIGKGTLEDRATIDVAMALGASKVYLPCELNQRLNVKLMGAKPLPADPGKWINYVDNKIDIAIDSIGSEGFEYTKLALNDKGILVATGMSDIFDYGDDFISNVESAWNHFILSITPYTTFYYGPLHSYYKNKTEYLTDLEYLLKLLQYGRVKPKKGGKIGFLKVAKAHEKMAEDQHEVERKGIIIVDPWKTYIRKKK